MPLYRCTVLNSFGEKQKVTREASDETSLKAELRQDKIHLLRYHVVREKKKNEFTQQNHFNKNLHDPHFRGCFLFE